MTAYIGTPPTVFVIPVTKGADREFTLRRKNSDGEPVDWDAELWIAIDVGRTGTPPTVIDADVTADQAVVRIESTVCDLAKNGTRWRVIMSTGGSGDSLETPVAVGTFERHDG